MWYALTRVFLEHIYYTFSTNFDNFRCLDPAYLTEYVTEVQKKRRVEHQPSLQTLKAVLFNVNLSISKWKITNFIQNVFFKKISTLLSWRDRINNCCEQIIW